MTRDDGRQWLLELTQNITSQLKENKSEIISIWEVINSNKDLHSSCREQVLNRLAEIDNEVLKKFADLDKRLELTILKVGILVGALLIVGEFLIRHFLGK